MNNVITPRQRGQAMVEYILLILLVIAILAGLVLLGTNTDGLFGRFTGVFSDSTPEPDPAVVLTPIERIAGDFLERIRAYYAQYGRWPSSWSDRRFTDLGLDPDDWEHAVEGIYWNPHGGDVGLANKKGDNLQIYVTDLSGERLHLYDGWNIWCVSSNGTCYYHTVAPGNEVDISTIEVVTTKPKRDD
jgi:Flp pilus assembly pilin Flp